MGEGESYFISCWNCSASFNAMESTFCSHSDPTPLCPYCFKCSCDAPVNIRKEIEKNAPVNFLLKKKRAMVGGDKKLGEILFNSGKINEEELSEAIRRHRTSEKRMGEVFVEMGVLEKDELELYLVEQRSKEEIELSNFLPDLDLVEKIGLDLCLKRNIIPIEYIEIDDKKVLKIVISSPDVFTLIKRNGDLSEYMVTPCYSDEESVNNVMKKIKQYAEVRELIILE